MKTYSSFQSVKIEVVRLSKLPINNRRVKILGRYNIQIYPSLTVELLIVYFPALRNNKNWMGDGASGRGEGGRGAARINGVQNRGTMFSQFAKRSTRIQVGGIFKQLRTFVIVSNVLSKFSKMKQIGQGFTTSLLFAYIGVDFKMWHQTLKCSWNFREADEKNT